MIALAAIGLGTVLVLLALADLFVPARDGLLGYSRVFAPFLVLLFVPLGLVALWRRGRTGWLLGAIVLIGLGIGAVRFLPSLPGGAVSADLSLPQIHVSTWNLERDAVPQGSLIPALVERAPGIIGLQELTPDQAATISADPTLREHFPFQVLDPADDWSGMGLLSSWPMTGTPELSKRPPLIATTITPPDAPPLDVIVAHAPPPTMGILRSGPRYDPTRRDASILMLRDRLRPGLDAGRPTLLLGDFNTIDRELGYADLTDGLTDSWRAAGSGFGHTWRPPSLAGLPFGLLRLDMVLTGPGILPIASEPDCSPRQSDHCILDVVLAIQG